MARTASLPIVMLAQAVPAGGFDAGMNAEKWRAFRLRWMLPIYLALGIPWIIAIAIQFAVDGPPSPLGWFNIVLVGLIVVVGTITEWRYRREERSSH